SRQELTQPEFRHFRGASGFCTRSVVVLDLRQEPAPSGIVTGGRPWRDARPTGGRPMAADSSGRDFCLRCQEPVNGIRPTWSSKVLFAAMIAVAVVVMAGSTLLGWGLVLGAPIVATAALCLGPLAAVAFAPARCPVCGALVTLDRNASR